MPALVDCSADDEFNPSFNPNPYAKMYFPPSKIICLTHRFGTKTGIFKHEKKPSIEALPNECLFEILTRLPSTKERSSCSLVSKRWLFLLSNIRKTEFHYESSKLDKISNDDEDQELDSNGFLTRCLEENKATDIRLAAISVATGPHGGLGKLLIRGSDSTHGGVMTSLGLSAIARASPSLRTLSLWNVSSSVGDTTLLEISKECHLLEKLDLSYRPSISNTGLIAVAENCPSLSVLNIESCPMIGNEGLQAIGMCCPKLQSISIRDCPLVGDQGISGLFSSSSLVVTKVKLQRLNISDSSLAVIGQYGKVVTNLMLSNLHNVTEKGIWVMGNARGLTKLTSLTFSACQGLTDLSLKAIGEGLSSLKQLSLRKCCFVSDSGLGAFSRAISSLLESLTLEECKGVTLLGVLNILSNGKLLNLKSLTLIKCIGIKDMTSLMVLSVMLSPCKSLQYLSIRNCPGFGNDSLSLVSKLCPSLKQVDLTGLFSITNSGLLSLLEKCKEGLVKMDFTGCLKLTDEVVSTMVKLHGGTLEVLVLNGCWKITDLSLVVISDWCLLLDELDVSMTAITDLGLRALSSANHINLQVLSLSGCPRVSNKSLPFLTTLGKNLLGLNLKNCPLISSNVVEILIENLWRCDILV